MIVTTRPLLLLVLLFIVVTTAVDEQLDDEDSKSSSSLGIVRGNVNQSRPKNANSSRRQNDSSYISSIECVIFSNYS